MGNEEDNCLHQTGTRPKTMEPGLHGPCHQDVEAGGDSEHH